MTVPADVAANVAANIRRLRAARGWSLDAFATRSGVSKGMLVQVEQARTNPSLGTLCRVAEALSVSLAALVETAAPPGVQVVPPGGGTTLWRGAAGGAATLLAGCDERDHVELWHWELAPGDERRAGDGHAEGTRELLHVLAGELELEVAGVVHAVAAGGAASFHADRPHTYRNAGSAACRFVMVVLQSDADLEAWAAARVGGEGQPGAQHERLPPTT